VYTFQMAAGGRFQGTFSADSGNVQCRLRELSVHLAVEDRFSQDAAQRSDSAVDHPLGSPSLSHPSKHSLPVRSCIALIEWTAHCRIAVITAADDRGA